MNIKTLSYGFNKNATYRIKNYTLYNTYTIFTLVFNNKEYKINK